MFGHFVDQRRPSLLTDSISKRVSVGLVPAEPQLAATLGQQTKPLSVGLAPVGSNVFRSEVSLLPPGQAQTGSTEFVVFGGSRQLFAPTGTSPTEA